MHALHGDRRPPQRVLIFRALPLGEMLGAVPAFRALRKALPAAHIVLAGLPWARAFAAQFDRYINDFVEFPGYPGLPEQPPRLGELATFLDRVRDESFDLALQMHGNGIITNPLTLLFGARRAAGFYQPGQFCPDPRSFVAYPARLPETWRWLRLLEMLGVPPAGEYFEFPLRLEDYRDLQALPGAYDLRPGGYACIHPGARDAQRQWPAADFAAVADALAGRGLQVVLTGTRAEAPLTQAVAEAMRAEAIDLTGQTSLGVLGALLQGSRLLVSHAAGVAHLAAALHVNSVVVMHGEWQRESWPSPDRQRHRVVCRFGGATPGDVLAQARELLDTDRPAPAHLERPAAAC